MTAGRITALISRFRRDTRGNIAVIFAIATVPMITAVGCATDYSMAARMKSKLQSAADTASLASISLNSAGWTAASAMTSNGSVAAGVTEANNVFNGNAATFTGYQNLSVNSTVTKTGSTLTIHGHLQRRCAGHLHEDRRLEHDAHHRQLEFELVAAALSRFLSDARRLRLDGTAVDVGRSRADAERSIRTTTCNIRPAARWPAISRRRTARAPTAARRAIPTNNYCLGYAISRVSQSALSTLVNAASAVSRPTASPGCRSSCPSPVDGRPIRSCRKSIAASLTAVTNCPTDGTDSCIQLRLDAVGYAVNQLFATPTQKAVVTNQFRIGLYPFITVSLQLFPADQQHQRIRHQFVDHQLRRRQSGVAARHQHEFESRVRRHAYRHRDQQHERRDHQRRQRQRVEQHAALRLPRHRRRAGSANQGRAQRRLGRQQPRHHDRSLRSARR